MKIGPFVVNPDLLIFLLSSLIGYILLKLRLRSDAAMHKNVSDTLVNALILSIFVWKLSPLVFDFRSTIQQPLSLLYFNGGDPGILLAVLLSMLYILYRARKDQVGWPVYLEMLFIGYLGARFAYHALGYLFGGMLDTPALLQMLLAGGTAVWMLIGGQPPGERKRTEQTVLWYSLFGLFFTYLSRDRVPLVWGFSGEQVIYVLSAAAALGLSRFSGGKSSMEINGEG
ncbi:hypothetical protein [Ferviditalea candida]|uniref:Prolipoprotein diacylglyceryl transferase n=1 Tax=Ferviditalea candida TaxID=3108399 RepID=A0ABU5ZIV1_9BACL|nr:hypothetical protein [Paenibacillaceae bacterium T2]